jgi:hypothetical protein
MATAIATAIVAVKMLRLIEKSTSSLAKVEMSWGRLTYEIMETIMAKRKMTMKAKDPVLSSIKVLSAIEEALLDKITLPS